MSIGNDNKLLLLVGNERKAGKNYAGETWDLPQPILPLVLATFSWSHSHVHCRVHSTNGKQCSRSFIMSIVSVEAICIATHGLTTGLSIRNYNCTNALRPAVVVSGSVARPQLNVKSNCLYLSIQLPIYLSIYLSI